MIKIFTFLFLIFFSPAYCAQISLGWSFFITLTPQLNFPTGSLFALYRDQNIENLRVGDFSRNGVPCHIIVAPNGNVQESLSVFEIIMTGNSLNQLKPHSHRFIKSLKFERYFYNPQNKALVFVYTPH